ncbi:VWA domain-containing protein [Thermaerobacter sp. PB12/4term]|uniref:vWA domain-containing protein n=1 Tax=Thermaerobacter sp. PB12/4term TaxID=2293838 RepID=UPI000E327BE8|nr:VWA domain-containing protein [Thermaerobacter sp. PB12/4term]QIA27428.1 VWA domain-containing protein [Thermaerobacter sp. PB12/4term]
MEAPSKTLRDHVIHLVRRLRAAGVPTSPADAVNVLAALEHVDLEDPAEVRAALRVVLARRPEHLAVVERALDAFFWGEPVNRRLPEWLARRRPGQAGPVADSGSSGYPGDPARGPWGVGDGEPPSGVPPSVADLTGASAANAASAGAASANATAGGTAAASADAATVPSAGATAATAASPSEAMAAAGPGSIPGLGSPYGPTGFPVHDPSLAGVDPLVPDITALPGRPGDRYDPHGSDLMADPAELADYLIMVLLSPAGTVSLAGPDGAPGARGDATGPGPDTPGGGWGSGAQGAGSPNPDDPHTAGHEPSRGPGQRDAGGHDPTAAGAGGEAPGGQGPSGQGPGGQGGSPGSEDAPASSLAWRARAGGSPGGYSPLAVLTRRDVHVLDDASRRLVMAAARELGRRLATRPSRRFVRARKGPIDGRRALREAARKAGDLFRWPRRRRRPGQLRLVAVLDVSGSMDVYSQLFLHFLHGLQQQGGRVETFALGTRLTRLTSVLRTPRPEIAMARAATVTVDWSGGTRLGEGLWALAQRYGYLLDPDTVLLVISDGLDRGNLDLLDRALRWCRRRVRAVVWMNPLAGDPRYEPLARGMQVALPHIDVLAPAHSLQSLVELALWLRRHPSTFRQLHRRNRPGARRYLSRTGAGAGSGFGREFGRGVRHR